MHSGYEAMSVVGVNLSDSISYFHSVLLKKVVMPCLNLEDGFESL